MNTSARNHRLAMLAHCALCTSVLLLAYLGRLPLPMPEWMHFDKLMHFILVGSFAYWITRGWGDPRIELGGLRLPVAVVVPLLLAGAEEALQLLSSRRNADVADFVADALGLLFFWWLARRAARRLDVGGDDVASDGARRHDERAG